MISCSKKQHIVSRSSTKAEYISLASVTAELTWLTSLLSVLLITMTKQPVVWCDNLSTVLLSANPVLHARTKHIELDLYFVLPSIDQTTDVFTKAITSSRFPLIRDKLRVVNSDTLSLRGYVRDVIKLVCKAKLII